VQDTDRVRRLDCLKDPQADLSGPFRRQRAILAYHLTERAVRDKLHHYPGTPVVLHDVVDTDQVRVVQTCRRPGLPQSAPTEGLLLGRIELRRPEDLLYRHVPMQQLVTGEPDNAHPAPAEHRPKPVLPGDKVPQLPRTHLSRLPRGDTT
jgi:hypothetical protein